GPIESTKSCVDICGGRDTGSHASRVVIPLCSLTGRWVCGVAPWREPYELRGSCTVLRERRGEIPRRYSPVTFNQLAIVSGILLAYLANWAFAATGPNGWRWMFAAAAAPAIAFCVALLFVPESPRWLIKEHRKDEAMRILVRIAGQQRAHAEAEEIRRTLEEEAGSLRELTRPGLRLPLIIAVTLAILQQISGVNTVLYYGALIFRQQSGEQSATGAIALNVAVGVVNAISTLVAIAVIDKIGRKPLLLLSSAGM